MSIAIRVDSNMERLLRDVKLEQQAVAKAAQRAINKAADNRRTIAARALNARYKAIKVNDAKDAMTVIYASVARLTAIIKTRGRPLGLMRFVTGAVSKRILGASVRVKNGTQLIAHSFVAKGRNFGGGDDRSDVLFIRQQYVPRSKAGPSGLVALRTIDLANAVQIKDVAEALDAQTNDVFDKEFARQVVVLSKG